MPDAPACAPFAPFLLFLTLDIMRTKQGNMLQSLRNVESFLDESAAALDAIAQTGARPRLEDAITQLATHATDQDASHIASHACTRQQVRYASCF
ncbi:hypothetical protein BH09GEM1_BH09GEM1_46590 [soil metagenome]